MGQVVIYKINLEQYNWKRENSSPKFETKSPKTSTIEIILICSRMEKWDGTIMPTPGNISFK